MNSALRRHCAASVTYFTPAGRLFHLMWWRVFTMCRLVSRADEYRRGLLRVGAAGMHQTCRFKRSTSVTKAGVSSAISVSMSRT
jgi:hypothetical protein